MPGFQFVHMSAYSRKGDARGRSTAFILAEARRAPDASAHVADPAPPVVIHGVGIDEVERLHDAAADAATTTPKGGKPRRIQRTQHTLMTVVASHPHTMEEVRADPGKRGAALEWEQRTVGWLRSQYGDQLVSVIRHDDESHYHLHAYILPDGPAMRASALHPGQCAKAAVMAAGPAEGEDAKALNKRGDVAYRGAMRAWQDSYHETVGVPCGLTRLGPQRRRLSRAEWHHERSQAQALRLAQERADALRAEVGAQAQAFVTTTKAEASRVLASARADAQRLREAAAQQAADATRRADAAQAAAAAAQAAQARAAAAAAQAQRERQAAERATSAARRLSGVGGLLRGLWDGLRRSSLAARIREELVPTVEQWQQAAAAAAARADVEAERRTKAERRAAALAASASELGAQRDALRERLDRYEPVAHAPVAPRRYP